MVFIVVDEPRVKAWATENKCEFDDACMKNVALKELIMKDLVKIADDNKFNSLEKPKQIHLIKDAWTIESDMLTPTMKTKRNVAKDRYKDEIIAMYAEGPMKKK